MAQTTLSTSTLRALVRPGLLSIESVMDTMAKSWEPDFEEIKSFRNYEETAMIASMGSARKTAEGTASYVGSMNQAGFKRFQIWDFTISVPITWQLISDNLYPEMAPRYAKSLMQSQLERANIEAAEVYNQATNNAFVGFDDKPLLDTDHPVNGYTIANTTEIPSPLQEDSLFELLTAMWGFRAASGIKMDSVYAKLLIISPALARQARVLLDSQFRPGTSSFEINPSNGTISDGFKVNRYIKPHMYFIRTNHTGLKYFNRQGFKIAQQPNVSTWAIYFSSIMRYNFGFDDFRCIVGSESSVVGNT